MSMIEELKKAGVIHGAGGGGDSGSARVSVVDPDTLNSHAMITVLDLLGEGEIGGLLNGSQSIFLNDTPLANPDGSLNFSGVTWAAQRVGTQGQTPIDGVPDIETPYPVGVRVRKDTPATVTVSNPETDMVRIIVAIPRLTSTDADDGDVHGTDVYFRFDISTDGGPYNDATGTIAISGKSSSKFQRAYSLTLPKPASSWNIRMVRLTDDSTTQLVDNETWFDYYTEIINSRLSYPNSALVAVRLDSAQFNSVPRRSFLVRGLKIKIPSNYATNAHTYSGVWDGSFKVGSSSNPAWVLYDLLTNERYGLGQFISPQQIDKATLYKIGRYCDEMVPSGFGGVEPRFTINTAIQSQSEAYKLISDITSAFRGMAFWTGGMVGFTQDMPTDSTMIYSPANVVDGVFNYSGSSRKNRHLVALITWNDPNEHFKLKIEYVEDSDLVAKYGVRKIDMVAFGCTSRGMAVRAGKWILYTEKEESDLVAFKVGQDSLLVTPGDVIRIHDPYRAGKRNAGMLTAGTATSATLDAPVDLSQPGTLISLRLPDGSFIDRTIDLTQGAGTYATVTWADPLPAAPVANSMWLITEPNLQPLLARVVGITQDAEPGVFAISAIEHNPSKYNAIENGWALEPQKISLIDPNKVTAPVDLQVTEVQYQVAPGVIGTKLHVSWSCTEPTFALSWRRTGDKYGTNWTTITTTTPSVDIENVRSATHEFELQSINSFGRTSAKVTLSYVVKGHTTAPGDVYNFNVTQRTSDLLLTWDAVKDIDSPTYEIREGVSWDAGTVVISGFSGTMITHDQNAAGTYHYHIRSKNKSGIYSDNVTTCTLILYPPSQVAGFDCVQSISRLEFRWNANEEKNIVGYEIREGDSWATSQLITQTLSTSYTTPAGAAGNRMFWIKAIASPGIYSDKAVFVNTAIAARANSNLLFTDDEKANGWNKTRHYASDVGGFLTMDFGAVRAEYVFKVDLGDTYRAQNSLFTGLQSVDSSSSMTWNDATFNWTAQQAQRQWTPTGDMTSVSARFQIAPFIGKRTSEVDGWQLDNDLGSLTGSYPAARAGVSYAAGRYANGLML